MCPGRPRGSINGIDVSLIDKSVGSTVTFSASVGGMDFSLDIGGSGPNGAAGVFGFQPSTTPFFGVIPPILSVLTPGLAPTDIGYTTMEFYDTSTRLNSTFNVFDPVSGETFSQFDPSGSASIFSFTKELTAITASGYKYDMELVQHDINPPPNAYSTLLGGDLWEFGFKLKESSSLVSTGSGLENTSNDIEDEQFLTFYEADITARNMTTLESFNINGVAGSNPLSFNVSTTVVPIPAAFWLFGSGLFGLFGIARKLKASKK